MKPQFPGNMQNMIKQAQKLQKDMAQAQEQLNQTDFVGKSADDAVVATFSGARQLKDLQIKPEALDPDDPDMLQDLIIMAVNSAMTQIDQQAEQTLGKYTPGF
ncbi:YbaB/EbfC family nucleoid-associated protein [Bombilactobacillus thymidiniphilus]|uniref:Nucleoid-associated protein MOO47_01720 n=1 Tax=Bombilactobacillus thymidiniphilus TaxID=2923363 RepID=A0ABY4PEK4_9LACO|nr:YbaB/EbfC family nucleoid-associated protein [Bombilactobacillus thymidiniphilus]UQS83934.1 YbaB/EbfC family nucleoid-associated protein [Bombilactobacillus thymidiniphilus]